MGNFKWVIEIWCENAPQLKNGICRMWGHYPSCMKNSFGNVMATRRWVSFDNVHQCMLLFRVVGELQCIINSSVSRLESGHYLEKLKINWLQFFNFPSKLDNKLKFSICCFLSREVQTNFFFPENKNRSVHFIRITGSRPRQCFLNWPEDGDSVAPKHAITFHSSENTVEQGGGSIHYEVYIVILMKGH